MNTINISKCVVGVAVATLLNINVYANTCDDHKQAILTKGTTEHIIPLESALSSIDKFIDTYGKDKFIIIDEEKGDTKKAGEIRVVILDNIRDSKHELLNISNEEYGNCKRQLGAYLYNEDLEEDYGFIGKSSNFLEGMSGIVTYPVLKLFGADGANNDLHKGVKLLTNSVLFVDKTGKELGRAHKNLKTGVKKLVPKNIRKGIKTFVRKPFG